jgi:alpha-D-xyloside xylohydrolase
MKEYTLEALRTPIPMDLLHGAAEVSAKVTGKTARLTAKLSYSAVYGTGERFNGLNQKGRTVSVRVEEQFCNQGEKTYCASPFFVTDTGFALYVKSDCAVVFSFAQQEITAEFPADAAVYLGAGAPADLVAQYMRLTGPAVLPPKWAFAPWISANHWNSQAQVEQQAEALRHYDFPASTLVVEAWSDEATFYIFNGASYTPRKNGEPLRYADFDFSQSPFWQDPAAMIKKLHAAGLHLVLWQIPVYKKQGADEEPNVQNDLDWTDAVQRGLCVKTKEGAPYTIPEKHWFAGSLIPDFTNPETRRTWFAKRQYLLDIGVDGFKTDGGEFVCSDNAAFHDGSTGAEQANRYAEDYTEAYSRFIGPDRVLFSRAGYTGQQKAPCHWAGDHQSTNAELKSVLSAGLSAAMSGIPFWGFDIAGFAGPLPTLDLYRRATMLACFSPIMQWHSEPDGGQFRELMPGGEGNNERSPWNMASAYQRPEFVDEMRFWHKLRMNLLPYLYTTAIDCCEKAAPMMRPLVYGWPDDAQAVEIEDEYLLGESLLIAPLMETDQTQRTLYLPAGRWTGLFSRKTYPGGQAIVSDAEEKFPVYLRAGCALPLFAEAGQPLGQYEGNAVAGKPLHFLLAGSRGTCRFRDEDKNDFTMAWDAGKVEVRGKAQQDLSIEFLP